MYMAEKDSSAIGLTPEQTGKVVDGLHEEGATFFTWEQLQALIKKLGPRTRISDVQKKTQKDQETKQ